MDPEIFIPIFAMTMVFGIFYFFITTRHKERMKLIESGADASMFYNSVQKRGAAIKIGMLLIGIGFGIFIGNLLASLTVLDEEVTIPSMIMICAGAGLLIGNKIVNDMDKKEGQS